MRVIIEEYELDYLYSNTDFAFPALSEEGEAVIVTAEGENMSCKFSVKKRLVGEHLDKPYFNVQLRSFTIFSDSGELLCNIESVENIQQIEAYLEKKYRIANK